MTTPVYTIRKAAEVDAEDIAFVHVDSWKTSYAGIIAQIFLDNISYEKRLALRKKILKAKDTLHLVAILDEQIIGFADAGPVRSESRLDQSPFFESSEIKIGEIYTIYLLEHYKGKGLGTALLKQCRFWFGQHGLDSFVTWVLVDNLLARRFYEKEGGVSIGETMIPVDDKSYLELCYFFETQAT